MHSDVSLVDMIALLKVVICGGADGHAPRLGCSLSLTTLQEYWINDAFEEELDLATCYIEEVQLLKRVEHLDALHWQV